MLKVATPSLLIIAGLTLYAITKPWLDKKWQSIPIKESNNLKFLNGHRESHSPQALQGMWQAYGQVRAARTQAFGAILTAGVLGGMLSLFQQHLSRQAKANEQLKRKLNKRDEEYELRVKAIDLDSQKLEEYNNLKVVVLLQNDAINRFLAGQKKDTIKQNLEGFFGNNSEDFKDKEALSFLRLTEHALRRGHKPLLDFFNKFQVNPQAFFESHTLKPTLRREEDRPAEPESKHTSNCIII